MRYFAGICVVAVAVWGQTAPMPAKWIGTWKLNVPKSTFETPLLPGLPADFKIVSQTVRIERTAREIRLSGDTVVSDSSGSHSGRDDHSLSLDGQATGEVSHFAISADGRTLTETKTQTERAGVPEGSGAVLKKSTSVLVFNKVPERL